MTTQPEPQPEERDAPPERHIEEEAMRGPGQGRPHEIRKDVGLGNEREPGPEGPPAPSDG